MIQSNPCGWMTSSVTYLAAPDQVMADRDA
jgi:hypothetical protein